MFPIVEAEATVLVETALCVPLEDLRPFSLTNFTDGVNRDCQRNKENSLVTNSNDEANQDDFTALLLCLTFILSNHFFIGYSYSFSYKSNTRQELCF